jgi:hypothetical protein
MFELSCRSADWLVFSYLRCRKLLTKQRTLYAQQRKLLPKQRTRQEHEDSALRLCCIDVQHNSLQQLEVDGGLR